MLCLFSLLASLKYIFLSLYSTTTELLRKEFSGNFNIMVEIRFISIELACFCRLFDVQLSLLYHILLRGKEIIGFVLFKFVFTCDFRLHLLVCSQILLY